MTNMNKTVDVAALDLLCDKLECGDANHRATAEQIRKAMNGAERTKTEHDGVDVDALLELANKFDGYSTVPSHESFIFTPRDFNIWSKKIRDSVKGAKLQLPEGIEWPRFEDGELVKFGDEFVSWDGETHKVLTVEIFSPESDHDYAINSGYAHNFVGGKKSSHGEFVKRAEPEVLDADGVPVKVGDTVYWSSVKGDKAMTVEKIDRYGFVGVEGGFGMLFPDQLTHRKPDTQEAIDADCLLDASDYCEKHGIKVEHKHERGKAKCKHLLERQRKLMGGE